MQRAAQAVASNVQSVGELEAKVVSLNGLVARELQRVDGNLSLIASPDSGKVLGQQRSNWNEKTKPSEYNGSKDRGAYAS